MNESLLNNLIELAVVAIPVATVAWTVTHEELFRDLRDWLSTQSLRSRNVFAKKLFYAFTCEFCFSFYVAFAAVVVLPLRVLYPGIRGSMVNWTALVWIANVYMSIYARLRLDIKKDHVEIAKQEKSQE